jgi:SRSO17 transposase
MDVAQMQELGDDLESFLAQFDACFERRDTRRHLSTYVQGQLADLPAKSVEPIALHAGTPVRSLQEFLAHLRWEEDAVRRRLAHLVRDQHGGPHAIGIIDETSDVKKGDKTPGVQRQWCGKVGKKENCVVSVHLGYAREDFHCLLDGELFLPQSWAEDRPRCRQAGIPDTMQHRPKWQIALELYDRAVAEGLAFEWITADEYYGGKPGFLEELETRRQKFLLEVPRTFSVWIDPPEVTERAYRKTGRGRSRAVPRVKQGQPEPRSVEQVLWHSEAMKATPWVKYHLKDTQKGPEVWEAKRIRVTLKGSDDLPGMRLWLIVARNVLDPGEMKFFVSNAPETEPMETLLWAAFSRWRVERCFRDQKQEIGLDCYEGRLYLGLKRHLILSSVSYLFLSLAAQRLGKKKSVDHHRAAARSGQRDYSVLVDA